MGKNQKIKLERKLQEIKKQKQKKERRKKLLRTFFVGFIVFILGFVGVYGYKKLAPQKPAQESSQTKFSELTREPDKKKYDAYPEMVTDQNKKYTATMKTDKGDIILELDAKNAPKAVNNFVFLSQKGFYDGLTFHRIVKDFMIQGGDPNGDGTGDAGYKFDDEPVAKDYLPGTLAMANSGKNTNGSQFFIMTGDYSGGKLPKNYVIFGNVTSGMDIVNKIAETPVEDGGQGEASKPKEKVTVNSIEIKEGD